MTHKEEQFEEINFPQDCYAWCSYLIKTPDANNTGDSPTEYECTGNPEKCPLIK